MTAESFALERVTADLVSAGLSPLIAPTPARLALERIRAGEDGAAVVREIAADWGTPSAAPSPKPVPTKAKAEAPPARPASVQVCVGMVPQRPAAAIEAERKALAVAGGNPFAAGSISITRQILLERSDPKLAAKLKAEAGK